MILSLTVHEFAHAWSAYKLGDDTAKRMGRLTLNPIPHIDILGTLILPILLTIQGGGFFFGWAKPVPVNPLKFRRGISIRQGDILTAVAGPLSNVLIALIVSGVFLGSLKFGLMAPGNPVLEFLRTMFFLNIALAVFNMIPIPPLDGHYLLPENIKTKMQQYQMFFFVGLILVINFAGAFMAVPIIFVAGAMESFWTLILGGF